MTRPTAAILLTGSELLRGVIPDRNAAYLAERFPVLGHGVLIFAYYSSSQFLAQTAASCSSVSGWALLRAMKPAGAKAGRPVACPIG